MANTKISALPSGAPSQSSDLVPIARAGANFSVPLSGLFTGIGSAVILADNQTGADWGAKVQAADTLLGATAGEIWITQAAGTAAPATDITLNTGHVLRFLQGGTWNLGASRILIPAGALRVGIVGSASTQTKLQYNGTDYAIVVGAAGATLTEFVLIQDMFIANQAVSGTGGCIKLLVTLFTHILRCELACNSALAQTGLLSDGTGNFSAFTRFDQSTINLATFGIKMTGTGASGNNSNQFIGGSITGVGKATAGSYGIDIDSGDSNDIIGLDIESVDLGLVVNSARNLVNCLRFEGASINTHVTFTASSSSNKIYTINSSVGFVTSDAGTTNQVFFTNQNLAPTVSPAFTGTPTAPTQAANDNSTKLATTAYSDTATGLLVPKTTTVNGHALSANVVVSASDLTTGTLAVAHGGTGQTQAGQYGVMIARSAVNVAQSTQAEAVVFTGTIPAGLMTSSGWIKVVVLAKNGTVTGNVTYRVRMATTGNGLTGSQLISYVTATSAGVSRMYLDIGMRGATNSQISGGMSEVGSGLSNVDTNVATSLDFTANAIDIVVTAQMVNADANGANFQAASIIAFP